MVHNQTCSEPAANPGIHRLNRLQAHPKSPIATVLWNVLLPGAGYLYCGYWILGLVVLALALILASLTDGLIFAILLPLLVIDGFRVTEQVNRRLAAPQSATDQRSRLPDADSP